MISVVLTLALVMPAFPLSAIAPAFADEPSQASAAASHINQTASLEGAESQSLEDLLPDGTTTQAGLSEVSAAHPGQIYAELALDGSVVDDQGTVTLGSSAESDAVLPSDLANIPTTDEEKQAILDAYLADGTITEADLEDEFVTKSLTGEYLADQAAELSSSDPVDLKQNCGNFREGYEATLEEARQKEEEAEQQAQQLAETDNYLTAEVVEEVQRKAAEEEEPGALSAMSVAFDASPSDQSYSSPSAQQDSGSYSTAVTLKDIQSFRVLDTDGELKGPLFIGYPNLPQYGGLKTDSQLIYVKMYNTPSFYAKMVSGRLEEDGRYILTLQLPQSQGQEAQTIDVFYGYKSVGGFVNPSDTSQTVNYDTMLAALASVPGYDPSRNNAYLNAFKLSPFASYEDVVKSGNAMPATGSLATKQIQELWPIHEEQGMKVSLLEGEESGVVRCMVYFSDNTHEIHELDYLGTNTLAASYVMKDNGVLYQPDFWVLGEDSKHGIDRIAAFIRSKEYNDYFRPFNTSAKMHRTVRDYFDRNIHANAEEVAANLVSNIDSWNASYTNFSSWDELMHIAEEAQPAGDWDAPEVELKMFNLLFLYTYWSRFFDIDIGGSEEIGLRKDANMFLVMAFRGGVIKPGCSLANMTYSVRANAMLTFSTVRLLSETVISNKLQPFTGIGDAPTMVRTFVQRTTDYADVANWFADHMSSIAFYHEYKPAVVEGHPETEELIWRGWDQASRRYPNYLPLWLTMDPGAMYMASTSMILSTGSTYIYTSKANFRFNDAYRASFKARLDGIFSYAAQYSSTIATIVGKERVNTTIVLVLDNMTSMYDHNSSQNVYYESHGLWGKEYTQDPWQKHFYDVSELYDTTGGQGAAAATYNMSATNKRILFLAHTSLGCQWSYYWSHEMAHALDNDVFLGAARREGASNEDFTDGLLTQQHGAMTPVVNLCYNYGVGNDRFSNYTMDRIYGKDETNDFYGKAYEAMDVLDYAALQAFLRLDKDEQNAVASQVWFGGQDGTSDPDSGTNVTVLCSRSKVLNGYDGTTATMPVNESVFNDGSRKFRTIEEVYDNQLFLRPGIADGGSITWRRQIYVSEDNRGTWWFPVHNNGFYPDSRSFKVMMYRMLGREGYDAFATYGSTGGNDLQKLKQITGCSSYKEWQMGVWNEIEAKKDKLAYADFDDLVDKFEVALKTDAEKHDRNLGASFSLRTRMFYLMKRTTDDFRYGLYENQKPVTHIRTLDDLLAIANDPQGNYVLDADIDVTACDNGPTEALVSGVFYGKFDGQGHRIYSSDKPVPYLFGGMRHAYVKDLALDGVITETISPTIANCELENLSYTRFERDIYTVDDFVGIANDLQLGVKTFHLKADLDFAEWSAANEAAETRQANVVAQPMIGTLDSPKVFDGGGHTLSGLKGASFFGRVCFAEISGLSIENCENLQDVVNTSRVGLLSSITYMCKFTDIFFNNVRLSARSQVGFVSGDDGLTNAAGEVTRDGGSQFSRIQVANGTLTVGTSSVSKDRAAWGGFVTGVLAYSTMEDVYVQGTLTTYGTKCGGVVGEVTKAATLKRCVSNVNMDCKASPNNGVVIGEVSSTDLNLDATSVSGCIGLGQTDIGEDGSFDDPNPLSCNRLAYMAGDVGSVFTDCYENADRRYGKSMVGEAVPGVGFVRTTYRPRCIDNSGTEVRNYPNPVPSLRNDTQFFTDLGFDEGVWEFDPTIQVGYPMLKFVDDLDTFYDYDISISLDFKNEELRVAGSDLAGSKFYRTMVHNLPFRSPMDNYEGHAKGEWVDRVPSNTGDQLNVVFDASGVCDLSEIIEYEGFKSQEVAQKGTRSVTIIQSANASGKPYSFEKSIEIPPRPDMDAADRVRGVRANSKGVGAIHFASIGIYDADELEYRPVAGAGAAEGDAGAGAAGDAVGTDGATQPTEASWIPITSAMTSVAPGDYEVRIAATDHSFASYPVTVTVPEFDPAADTFPLVMETNGGRWAEGYDAPDEYSSEKGFTYPGADKISRPGYTFMGWYATEDFSGQPVTGIPSGSQEPVAVFARWSANTYSVKLNLNGGTLADAGADITQYTTGMGAALPKAGQITMPYRTFGGWFDNEACEGEPVELISRFDYGDKQYWAKWNTISYTVTLRLQGATLPEGVQNTFTYEAGVGAALPDGSGMTYEGHTFKGWHYDKECMGDPIWSISQNATGDMELWAKWTADVYDVTLVLNGGKLMVGETDLVSYQYGIEAELPDMERNGYRFEGWYDNADMTGNPVDSIPAGSMGGKTFWAKWTGLTYAIAYDLGEAVLAGAADAIDLTQFESYTTGQGKVLPGATEMVWDDHVFAGWYDSADFSGSAVTRVSPETYGDLTLYARWAGNACVLSYHTNLGSFETAPESVFSFDGDAHSEGDQVMLPDGTQLTRKGYAFKGWYSDEGFGGNPVESVSLVKGSIDLYAKWEIEQYGISYELNDGAFVAGYVPPSSYTVESGDVLLPSSGALVRDGFVFKGWHADAAFGDAAVSSIPSGDVGNRTFYAKWEEEVVEPPDPGPDEPDPDQPDPPGPDQPDPDQPDPPGPDVPDQPDPALPEAEILSLSFGGISQSVSWESVDVGHMYGRIEMLRSKMPSKAEDFSLALPEGVYAHSITKRMQALAYSLPVFYGAAAYGNDYAAAVADEIVERDVQARDGSQSDLWDIVLKRNADPDYQKLYTLEVVPLEEGEPTPLPPVTPVPEPTPTPTPDPGPTPSPTPGPAPAQTPTPVLTSGLGDNAALASTGDRTAALVLALAGLGLGALSLIVGLIARSRK